MSLITHLYPKPILPPEPRTFAIGDIHGCAQEFSELMARIDPDPKRDSLVILGDFVNRGPDTKGVIDHLLALQAGYRHLIVLRGNHEQMFLDFLAGRHRDLFLTVGGRETLASYGLKPDDTAPAGALPPEHLRFLGSLPSLWEDEYAIYVHAGLEPGIHLTQQSPGWLLWARDAFLSSDYDFGKPVVFGHTPFACPRQETKKIGIDTGAVYGGRLSCLILPEGRFVSTPGHRWWPKGNG